MQKTLYTEEYRRLITWLKEARQSKGLTMRDLAEKLDTQHSFIGKIEQGERRLDVVEYLKYCRALDIAPDEGLRIIEKY
tara:strand:+ start:438 stop:674 length:237 start_codon:yes stop_codon:yes gene_type:complete